jgi:hypothetical protein
MCYEFHKPMPECISKFVDTACELSVILGAAPVSLSRNGRVLAWDNKDGEGGYFMDLVLQDDGTTKAMFGEHTEQRLAHEAIGYCRYQNVKTEMYWENHKEVNDAKI